MMLLIFTLISVAVASSQSDEEQYLQILKHLKGNAALGRSAEYTGYGQPTPVNNTLKDETDYDECFLGLRALEVLPRDPSEIYFQIASAKDCAARCMEGNKEKPQICLAFVYNRVKKYCDHFDHLGHISPSKLNFNKDTDYYEMKNKCQPETTTTPSTSTPIVEAENCQEGEKMSWLVQSDVELDATAKNVHGIHLEKCLELCEANKDDENNWYDCKSFLFVEKYEVCALYADQSVPEGSAKLIPNEDRSSTFVEKICMTDKSLENCDADTPLILSFKDYSLIGSVIDEIKVDSQRDCISECIDDIKCLSGNYRPNTGECVLNGASMVTNPDRIVKRNGTNHFQHNCLAEIGIHLAIRPLKSTPRRIPVAPAHTNPNKGEAMDEEEAVTVASFNNEWGSWSGCMDVKGSRLSIRTKVCGNQFECQQFKQC